MITEIKMGPTEKELDEAAEVFAAMLEEIGALRARYAEAAFALDPIRWAALAQPREREPQARAKQLHRQICELMMRDDEMRRDNLPAAEGLAEINAFISALVNLLGASLFGAMKKGSMSPEGVRALVERLGQVAGVPLVVGDLATPGPKH